nr:unnamed protein product [Callosobruchus analis]
MESKNCYVYRCICGDFNFNFDECCNDRNATVCKNVFKSYGYDPLISAHTRVQNGVGTVTDNIFCNVEHSRLKAEVVPCDISDHFLQLAELAFDDSISRTSKNYVSRRLFSDESNICFLRYLFTQKDWSFLDSEICSDDKFSFFHDIF